MAPYTRPVVIVDDDVDHAVIARTVLASVAPEVPVTTLTDPRGLGTRLAEVDRGALVLIDRVLDVEESYSVIRQVAALRPDLRFVMLSAALSRDDAARAIRAGATGSAEKPGSLGGWRTLLGRLLDEAEAAVRTPDARHDGEHRDGAVA